MPSAAGKGQMTRPGGDGPYLDSERTPIRKSAHGCRDTANDCLRGGERKEGEGRTSDMR